jgi:amino acid adenylation domain-containing protein
MNISAQNAVLSPSQLHWWRSSRSDVHAGDALGVIALPPEADLTKLGRAINLVAEHNEILRTAFHVPPGMDRPMPVAEPPGATASLPVVEWNNQAPPGGADAREIIQRHGNGRCLRFAVTMSPGHSVLIVTLPPPCADRRTFSLLAQDIAEAYGDESSYRRAAKDRLQFADVAAWLNDLQTATEARPGREYWSRMSWSPFDLSAIQAVSQRRAGGAGHGRVPVGIDATLTAAIESLMAKIGVAADGLLLGLWIALLRRLSDRQDIVVGIESDGRKYEELGRVLGPMTQSLPIGVNVSEQMPIDELARLVGSLIFEHRHRQEFFNECLVPHSADRETDTCELAFIFDISADDTGHETSEPFRLISCETGNRPYEVKLVCQRTRKGTALHIDYDRSKLCDSDARRLSEMYATLLQAASAAPSSPIERLRITNGRDCRVAADLNRTSTPYPADACLHELFERHAAGVPDGIAVMMGEHHVSYSALVREVDLVACRLHGLGVGCDSGVVLHLDRSIDLVIALLATLKAGGFYIPLERSYPRQRLSFVLDEARPAVVVSDDLTDADTGNCGAAVASVHSLRDRTATKRSVHGPPAVTPDALAYAIYTSGSTGRPKGVMISHRSAINYLAWAIDRYRLAEGGGVLVQSPVSFDLSVTCLLGPLVAGGTVVLLPALATTEELARTLLRSHFLRAIKLTPAHLVALNALMAEHELAGRTNVLILGGEALHAEDLAAWRSHAPTTQLFNEYGPTEATVGCCFLQISDRDAASGAVPIGRPIANTAIHVLDAWLSPVPVGMKGELFVAGDGLARGYLRRADLTAASFVPHPVPPQPGARLYRTGDLGKLDDGGVLYFAGRVDAQVKLRGYRVEPGEIEEALRRHASVSEAAVTVAEDPSGLKTLVAFVTRATPGTQPSDEEIKAFLVNWLPEYMVPQLHVWLNALPLTSHGKVDRVRLAALGISAFHGSGFDPPRTQSEEILAGIWAHVLKRERIGINENYFALGGDSIRSLQIVALSRARGLHFTAYDLLKNPTVRQLARAANGAEVHPFSVPTAPFSLVRAHDRSRLPRDIEDAYPLTKLQDGMIFHSELDPEAAIYHDIVSYHVRAPLHIESLRATLDDLLRAHPTLRTSFDLTTFSEGLQLVHREPILDMIVEDMRAADVDNQERAIEAFFEREKRTPFDWRALPLVRFHVHVRSEETFQFTMCFHHAVLDGWSDAVLMTSLATQYLSLLKGRRVQSLPPAASFRDFVCYEGRALASQELRTFWEDELRGSVPLALPRWPRNPGASIARQAIRRAADVSVQTSDSLFRLAVELKIPVKSILLAAHMKVLSLLTGRFDVVSCLSSSGRLEMPDGERCLGLFLNSIPFRLSAAPCSWTELATAAFEVEKRSLPHRHYPMSELVRLTGARISEAAFYFTHYHVYNELKVFPEFEVLDDRTYEETSFALVANFRIDVTTGHVALLLTSDASQIDVVQLGAIAGYYSRVLDAIGGNCHGRHDGAVLLPAEEVRFLADAEPPPRLVGTDTLQIRFERQVEATPDATAAAHGGEAITYATLNQRANWVAQRLISHGIAAEEPVGLYFRPSIDLLVGMIGILKAGACYVPLDPSYPAARLSLVVEDVGIRMIVSTKAALQERNIDVPTKICLDLDAAEKPSCSYENPPDQSTTGNVAYIIHTSGSSGRPKGVMITHASVLDLISGTEDLFQFDCHDTWMLFHSFSFDFSVWEIWGCMLHGGRIVIVPAVVRRQPEIVLGLIEAERVTVLNQTPTAFRQLTAADISCGRMALRGVRVLIFGGEALDINGLAYWFERYEERGPTPINMYGITETTVHVTHRVVTATDVASETCSGIGRPFPGMAAYVVRQDMHLSPIGVAGEILVGGTGVARGYFNRPALTAERFIPDAFGGRSGGRLYRSGDSARVLPDGGMEFLGRIDSQIKLRGYRIEPDEVRAEIVKLAGIRDAAVVARSDRSGEKRLVAYVVCEPAATFDAGGARAALRRILPDFMVPASILEVEALPLTLFGKLDIAALPNLIMSEREVTNPFLAPRNATEEIVAGIWQIVLGFDRIGVRDDFFELGGHSLLATRLIALLREAFRMALPLRELFEHPNVADLSLEIVRRKDSADSGDAYVPLPTIQPNRTEWYQPFPLTDIQQAYLVGRQEGFELGNLPAQIYVEFEGNGIALDQLERAVNGLIARHDMLRAVMLPDGRQKVLQDVPWYRIATEDLGDLPPDAVEAKLAAVRQRMAYDKLKIDTWPLFEIRVHVLPGGLVRLHVTFDLLITDADSLALLGRELAILYQDPSAPLPPLEISFRDYLLAELALRDTPHYARAREYWLRRLDDLPPAPELPMVARVEALQNPRFRRLQDDLDRAMWRDLKARAAKLGVTPSAILLAAYAEVLKTWSGSSRFTINVTTYNCLPLHPQAQDLVGDFTSLTPLAVDARDKTFAGRARAIHAQLVEDLDHSLFGGVEIIRELMRRRDDAVHAALPIVFTSTLPLHARAADQPLPLDARIVTGITQSPQTLIDHQVSEEFGALTFRWDFAENCFQPGVVEAMFDGYCGLLRRLAGDGTDWQHGGRLSLVPQQQLELRRRVNETARKIGRNALHDGFLANARRQPNEPALIAEDRRFSYGELEQISGRVSDFLLGRGVRAGELVAVMATRGWDQVVGILGVLRAGGAYLPLDPDLPRERLALMLADSRARHLLSPRSLRSVIPSDHLIVTDVLDLLRAGGVEANSNRDADVEPTDVAYVIYTSGSTGVPNGVTMQHGAVVNTIDAVNDMLSLDPADRSIALSSLCFDLSVYDVFGPLSAGGAIVLPGSDGWRDPGYLCRLMEREQVTIWNSVPTLAEMLVEHVALRQRQLPSCLRTMMLSGDWIPVGLPDRVRRHSAQIELISLGGATEAAIWSIAYPITIVEPEWPSIPYGKPLANQRVYVLGEELQPVPDHVPGRIYIAGAGLARGYWGNDALTAQRFMTHLETGERLYDTGDLGRCLPSGDMEIMGRSDFQVKIRGHRIELGEIEAVLSSHSRVKTAVVSAVGDPKAARSLVAHVVLTPEAEPVGESSRNETPAAGGFLLTEESRTRFKRTQRADDSASVTILSDQTHDESYRSELDLRRSYRQYLNSPISSEALSTLLSFLRNHGTRESPRYLYGSAGGVYAVDVVIHLRPGAVPGFAPGFYRYVPLRHGLVALPAGYDMVEDLHWPANRAAVRQAQMSIFLVGDLDRIRPLYGDVARDFCLIEAGEIAQILMMRAPKLQIGLCQIGGLDFEPVAGSLGMREGQILLHSLIGGRIASEATFNAQPAATDAVRLQQADVGEHSGIITALRSLLEQKLPSYMVPTAIVIVDELPLTPNGKVDRNALPQASTQIRASTSLPGHTEMHSVLMEVLTDALGVAVGPKDNIFSLGANSLVIVRTHDQIEQKIGRQFPLFEMFRKPTVALLADYLLGHEVQPDHNDPITRADHRRAFQNRASRRRTEKRREEDMHPQQ